MDQKAKEACLDEPQWQEIVAQSLRYADKCKAINRVIFCHTIEPYKVYVKLCFDDGHEDVMELTGAEDCRVEFPKCEVLAETVFKR